MKNLPLLVCKATSHEWVHWKGLGEMLGMIGPIYWERCTRCSAGRKTEVYQFQGGVRKGEEIYENHFKDL